LQWRKRLGLGALTALVLSSMLGAGVFSLPQNMAAVAGPAALLIGWADYRRGHYLFRRLRHAPADPHSTPIWTAASLPMRAQDLASWWASAPRGATGCAR
jgi:hypothetical protein